MLDADIWGFSVPRLLGIDDRLEAEAVDGREKPMIMPRTLSVGRGMLKVVSTGFMVDEDTALMWRGLMLNKAVEQFFATCTGVSSTTCSSTCRLVRETSRWGWRACCRAPIC